MKENLAITDEGEPYHHGWSRTLPSWMKVNPTIMD